MLKEFSTIIINFISKSLLKLGFLCLAKILFIILLPLFIASMVNKRLLPVCVLITLLFAFLSFLLLFL